MNMFVAVKSQSGGALVMVLVMFAMFLVMMIAGTRFVALELRQAADQAQRDEAFHAAEAGVNYAFWKVNQNPVNPDLSSVTDHLIRDPNTDEIVGRFDITQASALTDGVTIVTVTAIGKAAVRTDIQETVKAEFQLVPNAGYGLKSWQHLP